MIRSSQLAQVRQIHIKQAHRFSIFAPEPLLVPRLGDFFFRETDCHCEPGGLDDIFDLIRRVFACKCGGLGADRDKKTAAKEKT